jgi:hypothetical protein
LEDGTGGNEGNRKCYCARSVVSVYFVSFLASSLAVKAVDDVYQFNKAQLLSEMKLPAHDHQLL